jgi:hypothetical protein
VLDEGNRLISLIKAHSGFRLQGQWGAGLELCRYDHVTQKVLPAWHSQTHFLQHPLLYIFKPLPGHSCALKAPTPFVPSDISAFNPSISKRTAAVKQIIKRLMV